MTSTSYLDSGGWINTSDHKKIGLMFLVWTLGLFLFGALLATFLKLKIWQGGVDLTLLRQMQTYHGVAMVFLVVIPIIPSVLGYFLLPLQLGAREMALPALSRCSLRFYGLGTVLVLASLFTAPVASGWTFARPDLLGGGSFVVLAAGLALMALSWVMTGLNFIVTVHRLRAPGLGYLDLPVLTWSLYLTSYVLVVSGMVFGGGIVAVALASLRGQALLGGQTFPLLWQQIFWFATTPAAFFALVPAAGVITEVIAGMSRRPVIGYRGLVGSLATLVVASFLIWGVRLADSGQGAMATFTFAVLSLLVVIPVALITFSWLATLWRGAVLCAAPTTLVVAFLVSAGIGTVLGLFLSNLSVGRFLAGTMFATAHIHYVMLGGVITALLAGVHFWWPKFTGRTYHQGWARGSAVLYLVGLNVAFFPQIMMGTRGLGRGLVDPAPGLEGLQIISTVGMVVLLLGFVFMAFNLVRSLVLGETAAANPWGATTLEWEAASPPVAGNFAVLPRGRGPYEG